LKLKSGLSLTEAFCALGCYAVRREARETASHKLLGANNFNSARCCELSLTLTLICDQRGPNSQHLRICEKRESSVSEAKSQQKAREDRRYRTCLMLPAMLSLGLFASPRNPLRSKMLSLS